MVTIHEIKKKVFEVVWIWSCYNDDLLSCLFFVDGKFIPDRIWLWLVSWCILHLKDLMKILPRLQQCNGEFAIFLTKVVAILFTVAIF